MAELPNAFAGTEDDDEACSRVKEFLRTPDGIDADTILEEGVEFVGTDEGREAMAKVLAAGRVCPELDVDTFDNLATLVVPALGSLLSQSDTVNASAYMKAVNDYFKMVDGEKVLLSEEQEVKDSPVWRDLSFWQNAIFEAISAERAKGDAGGAVGERWTSANAEERELRMQQEQNVAFGQVSCIAMQMMDLGGVDVEAVAKFLQKLQTLQVLTSIEHLQMLQTMVSARAGRTVSIMAEGTDLSGMVDSVDPFADAQSAYDITQRAKQDVAKRAYFEADTKAVAAAEKLLTARLLPGAAEDGSADEKIITNAGRVAIRLMDRTVYSGVLFLTSYRLAFISTELEDVVIELPILGIQGDPGKLLYDEGLAIEDFFVLSTGVELQVTVLKVTAKDVRQLYFIFDEHVVELLEQAALEWTGEGDSDAAEAAVQRLTARAFASSEVRKEAMKLQKKAEKGVEPEPTPMELKARKFRTSLEELITAASPPNATALESEYTAFRHRASDVDCAGVGFGAMYDATAEYKRQGALDRESGWRESRVNADYEFCETYPAVLLFPRTALDETINEVANFRNRRRLPALSWLHPQNGAAIVRCAQPKVGMTGKKSEADEKLFVSFAKAVPQDAQGRRIKRKDMGITMMDARPWASAQANRGRGGGVENVNNYKDSDTRLVFLNIDNIHVMRKSINKLFEMVRSPKRSGAVQRSELMLAELPWPTYVGRCMGGSATIIKQMHDEGRTVVVHCSDGWDRTAQLAAFPVLCMDPFYRTLAGFRVLVQREWCSFGHKFRDRLWGHKAHERSPVFVQFLDCVQNTMHAFPNAFEYNEWLLIRLADSIVSMAYSEWRFNTEAQRVADAAETTPASVWAVLQEEESAAEFKNVDYDPTAYPDVIRPPIEARTWLAYFNRWTEDPIHGIPEEMAGVSMGQLPAAKSRPRRSLEQLLLAGAKTPAPSKFIELPPRFKGALWQMMGKLRKDRQQYCVLHDFLDGQASLVYYEEESSLSTVPKGLIPLHKGLFSIAMMPKRSASADTGRTYFQLRWRADGSAGDREAAKTKMEGLRIFLELATSEEGSGPTAAMQRVDDVSAAATPALSELVATWMARRLTNESKGVKVNTLKLLDSLLSAGNGAFKAAVKQKCSDEVTAARAQAAVGSDEQAALIRSLTGKITRTLDADVMSERVAGSAVEKNVFSTGQEGLDDWLQAFCAASGQNPANIPIASDDEEAGLAEDLAATVEAVGASMRSAGAAASRAAADTLALTKRFSGKATAKMLEFDHGSDDTHVQYQLDDFELKVKAGKKDYVRWDVQGGWRVRWKLVAGAHNIGYHAYFVAAPHPPTQSQPELDAMWSEVEPLLVEATSNDESRASTDTVSQLMQVVPSTTKEMSERMTSWLAQRLNDSAIPVKIKTLRLIEQLFQHGNADYKLATKTQCYRNITAAKAFIGMPDPKHGDKPQNMVRSSASNLAATLEAAPDEARQDLVESATIPPHGTVREGMEVEKSGQLTMIFDNSYSKLRSKQVNFWLALEPSAPSIKLTIQRGTAGFKVVNIGVEAYSSARLRDSQRSVEPEPEPAQRGGLGRHMSGDSAAGEQELLRAEGVIAQHVERLFEMEGDVERDEVLGVIVAFRRLVGPSASLRSTVSALQASLLGTGAGVEAEIARAVAAATAEAVRSSSSSSAAAAAAAEEEFTDSDDELL